MHYENGLACEKPQYSLYEPTRFRKAILFTEIVKCSWKLFIFVFELIHNIEYSFAVFAFIGKINLLAGI